MTLRAIYAPSDPDEAVNTSPTEEEKTTPIDRTQAGEEPETKIISVDREVIPAQLSKVRKAAEEVRIEQVKISQALIHDWNDPVSPLGSRVPLFHDETLRDGLQSPSVRNPSIDGKKKILEHLVKLGVNSVCLGMPSAGPKATEDAKSLLIEIRDRHMPVSAVVAARTVIADLALAAEIQQQVGIPLGVAAFLGVSPIRMDVEGWDLQFLVQQVRQASRFSRQHNISLLLVTEDTTRARPAALTAVYRTALDEGAQGICLADTCGHATPSGVRRLVRFIREVVVEERPVRVDWHGHNDRGLALANAIAAFEAGADCLHGTVLGIGERCGNAALDQLMVNLRLLGYWGGSLANLPSLAECVAELCGVVTPVTYPVLGRDAFRTGAGVHAAAIVKALRRGDPVLADAVYSSVPASLVGRRQEIEIGPAAGRSSVIYWLQANGYDQTPELIERILQFAKQSDRILTDREIRGALELHEAKRRSDSGRTSSVKKIQDRERLRPRSQIDRPAALIPN